MATLSYLTATAWPVAQVTMPAASAGGDKVAPTANAALLVRNGDASSKTVTMAVPGNTRFGQADPDPGYVVPAGAIAVIPIRYDAADTATDGLVAFTYSNTTSLFVQPITIP